MDLRSRVPVFAHDASKLQVVAERNGGEIDVTLAALDAVDAGRFKIAHDVRQRPDRDAVHAAVVRIQSVEALAPEAVAPAQRFSPRAERGVGEQDGLERLQEVEGVDQRDDRLLVRVDLSLRGAGEEPEFGMVMESWRAAVLGIGLQVMEKHPVASVSDGVGAVLPPPGIDPHAGEGVSPSSQRLLQG